MKKGFAFFFLTLAVCSATLLQSCDTPKTIAWSYYYCAKDTLESGDPYAAKHFLDKCKASADKVLVPKADSLMSVIEKTIEENKVKKREE